MKDKNHLKCPFCLGSKSDTVYITSKAMLDQHFDDSLPKKLKCGKCGARGEKVVGCCRVRYEWQRWKTKKDYENVAYFECSDCGTSYYAKIEEREGRFEIGKQVDAPPKGIKVRRQRMLCGGCQGKGGKGDQLNEILRRQRNIGAGTDPFGLF